MHRWFVVGGEGSGAEEKNGPFFVWGEEGNYKKDLKIPYIDRKFC